MWGRTHDDEADDLSFSGLHWMVAGLFVAVGAEAMLSQQRTGARIPRPLQWAPLLAAPLAGMTHVLRAVQPGPGTRIAAQVANGLAVGVGAAGVAAGLYEALQEGGTRSWPLGRRGSFIDRAPLAPLTFGATGILGALLDQEEQEEAAEQARLKQRASLVDRLVPRRRAKLDRIVIHI
jgi:hypothetical protein